MAKKITGLSPHTAPPTNPPHNRIPSLSIAPSTTKYSSYPKTSPSSDALSKSKARKWDMNEQNLQIKDLSISKDFSSSTKHLRRVDVSLMNKNLCVYYNDEGRRPTTPKLFFDEENIYIRSNPENVCTSLFR